jgi:prepilin-type N-terminal cleavage/methylation domain-containing protein/prepilin-type processing-associated H-X9-DG protein
MSIVAGRRGFTLIELLVVVAIIALLIAILLPSLARAREQAKQAVCASNVKMLNTAAIAYVTDWNAYVGFSTGSDRKMLLFPYVNQGRNNADVSGSQVWSCPATLNAQTQAGYGFNTKLNWRPFSAVRRPVETVALGDGGRLDTGAALVDSLTTQLNAPTSPTTSTCLRPNPRHLRGTALNVGFVDGHVESTPLGLPLYPPPNANNRTTWQYAAPPYTNPDSPDYADGWWDLN